MAEVSKQVANWALVTRTVSSALEQHGADLAVQLERELFPDGAPAGLTVAGVLEAMSGALRRRLEETRRLDRALAVERADDPAARDERDAAIAELRAALLGARGAVEGAFGPAAATRTGLAGRLPDNPDQLVQRARAAADLLSEAELGEPASGIRIDGAAVAARLRGGAERLAMALEAVQREAREEQERLDARNRAVEGLSRCYSGIADATAGFLTVVDRAEVADRVRPTARRRSGLPEPDDEPAADPAADGPDAPAPVEPEPAAS
jgi:hypothetical protein